MFANNVDTPEQERILQQLKELFVSTPNWKLRQTCISNDWDLELCVNHLTNATFCEVKESNTMPNVPQNCTDNKMPEKETSPFTAQENKIGDLITNGYRVMLLMRGPPGVGKSFWAKSLVTKFVKLQPPHSNVEDFVFSSDDYFRNNNGEYKYNIKLLSEAHEFNNRRVRENTAAGLSPIIIDNTNMQLWEMMPYVQAAVQNGYLLEIVEPKTPWHKCAYKLSQRNKHGVPANKIRRMMDKYEKGETSDLIKMLKNTKYTVSLPVLRSLPPFTASQEQLEDGRTIKFPNVSSQLTVDDEISSWGTFDQNAPKDQRNKVKSIISRAAQPAVCSEQIIGEQKSTLCYQKSPIKSSSARDVYSLLEKKLTCVWKPYEAESIDFWGKNLQKDNNSHLMAAAAPLSGTNDTTNKSYQNKSLLALLRDDSNESETNKTELTDKKDTVIFERHSVGCPSENSIFVTLRQIYPNKQTSGLWDLFQKCNGDIDWAVDILLKEDELAKLRDDNYPPVIYTDNDNFICSCSSQHQNKNKSDDISSLPVNPEILDNNEHTFNNREAKHPPQRQQRTRFNRANYVSDPALQEVKENIENCFVLGDDHYSQHLLKIRNIRSGLLPNVPASSTSTPVESCENEDNQEDDDDDVGSSGNADANMLEMSLGEQLVQQLLENFQSESSLEVRIPPTLPLNLKVFMPRSLAKQLYLLWMESAYNHLEEERQQMVREDEEFARLLKHPQYSEYKQSPSNLREMLDIEYAWTLYKRDKEELEQQMNELEKQSQPNNLAAHLTQIKLCETFPDIPRDTLLDILATTDNNYRETVSILRSTMEVSDIEATESQEESKQQQTQKEMLNQRDIPGSSIWDDNEPDMGENSWSPENAKRQALRQFEEARNLAAHHCQLRAECYQKAKEAIQAGNGGAGLYYSQIANLHKQKIDMYNHRAANCIMNVHRYTQNNPDHLDLHYLHMLEALGCLDLFLDRHITALRLASRSYKYVFIITGRGKHSAGGVSVIKSKVKSRLEERSLKWNEVNPGLLKVKVFSSSRHSQSFL